MLDHLMKRVTGSVPVAPKSHTVLTETSGAFSQDESEGPSEKDHKDAEMTDGVLGILKAAMLLLKG